jgi:hypothetical protein
MKDFSHKTWVGLGIYISHKSSYRRAEMERYGIEYDSVVADLVAEGLIVSGRIDKKRAQAAFAAKFPDQLASQVHQYIGDY